MYRPLRQLLNIKSKEKHLTSPTQEVKKPKFTGKYLSPTQEVKKPKFTGKYLICRAWLA